MVIGDRLKELRERKELSQGHIEERSGLLRCYISRVENGHTVPSVETLEKLARALEVPMYQLFYDGKKPPALKVLKSEGDGWGGSGRDARTLDQFRKLLSQTSARDRAILLAMAQKLARSSPGAAKRRAAK